MKLMMLLLVFSVQAGEKAPAVNLDKPHYQVVVHSKEGKAGEKTSAQVSLLAKGKFKFNKAYPTKVTLSAQNDAVAWNQAVLKKKDAKIDDAGAQFEAGYTQGKAGKAPVEAEVRFSVCNEQTCEMVKEKVSWELSAK